MNTAAQAKRDHMHAHIRRQNAAALWWLSEVKVSAGAVAAIVARSETPTCVVDFVQGLASRCPTSLSIQFLAFGTHCMGKLFNCHSTFLQVCEKLHVISQCTSWVLGKQPYMTLQVHVTVEEVDIVSADERGQLPATPSRKLERLGSRMPRPDASNSSAGHGD